MIWLFLDNQITKLFPFRNVKHEEKICELEARVEELETTDICNKLITACDLDFGDLVTACGNQPQTLAEVLQLILDNLNTP